MSSGFGKGKDGKYNTLNVAAYKGRSVESKSSGPFVRHGGFQSLGKVGATRRVPPPASLPSLKSENLGNDPNISLVPKDGSGWASKTDPAPPTCLASQPRSLQQQPASSSYSQPTACPAQPTNVNRQNQRWSSPVGSHQPPTWGSSPNALAGKKMSGAVGGDQARGTIPSSEDFPSLGGFQKDGHGTKSKDQQLGIGRDLRPQNFSSWKTGGGKSFVQSDEDKSLFSFDDENKEQFLSLNMFKRYYPSRNAADSKLGEKAHLPLDERHPPVLAREEHSDSSLKRGDEESWAAMNRDVDYGEKLVFSDDEETHRKGPTACKENSSASRYEKRDSGARLTSHSNSTRFNERPMQAWISEEAIDSQHYYSSDDKDNSRSIAQTSSQRRYPGNDSYRGDPTMFLRGQKHESYDNSSLPQKLPKSEKEAAIERARKRREEEELRMEKKRMDSSKQTYGSESQDKPWSDFYDHTKPAYDSLAYDRVPGDGYELVQDDCGPSNADTRHSRKKLDSYQSYSSHKEETNSNECFPTKETKMYSNILKRNCSNSESYGNDTPRLTPNHEYEFQESTDEKEIKISESKSMVCSEEEYESNQSAYAKAKKNALRRSANLRSAGVVRGLENQDSRQKFKTQNQQPLPFRRLDQVKLKDFRVDDEEDSESQSCPSLKLHKTSERSHKSSNGSSGNETSSKTSNEKFPWSNFKVGKQYSNDDASSFEKGKNSKRLSSYNSTDEQEDGDNGVVKSVTFNNKDSAKVYNDRLRSKPDFDRDDKSYHERQRRPAAPDMRRQREGNYHRSNNKRSGHPTKLDHHGGDVPPYKDNQSRRHSSGRGRNFKNENYEENLKSRAASRHEKADGGRSRSEAAYRNSEQSSNSSSSYSRGAATGPDARRRPAKKTFGRYESKSEEESNDETFDEHKTQIKQTPAAPPPSTNVWEERAKKQQQQQVMEENQPLTFIPKQEDKKRTLKETAPVKKAEKPMRYNTESSDRRRSPFSGNTNSNKNHGGGRRQKSNSSSNETRGVDNQRRTTSPQHPTFQQQSRRDAGCSNVQSYDSSERKRGGRGRSRGNYGSGRGGSNHPASTTGQNSRGRGRRGARHHSPHVKQPVPSQGNSRYTQLYNPAKNLLKSKNIASEQRRQEAVGDCMTDETSFSDSNDAEVGRRRQLGENSDPECLSSYVSHSDQENQDLASSKPSMQRNMKQRGSKSQSNRGSSYSNRDARSAVKKKSQGGPGTTTFTARGAPSRRGRGGLNRGNRSSRGGYRGSHGDTNQPSTDGEHKQEQTTLSRNFRNNRRGSLDNSTPESGHHGDKPRKKRGNDRPPRFNNFKQYENQNSESSSRKGPGRERQTTIGGASEEHYETASDQSCANDAKKSTSSLAHNKSSTTEKSESNRKSQHQRGGGSRRGGRGSHHGSSRRNNAAKSSAATNTTGGGGGQVYMLHSVKYNDPSAVAGAIASSKVAATSNNKNTLKLESEKQERNRDLFQRYDLHNYAGVVNVDDIPGVSAQNEIQSGDEIEKNRGESVQVADIKTNQITTPAAAEEDDDGFTPVLSKRQQKKLQEEKKKETLKQEQSLAAAEILKKAHRQSRSKISNKTSIVPGASGGVRHASPSTTVMNNEKQISKEIWNSQMTWEKTKDVERVRKNGKVEVNKKVAAAVDKSIISQHDSGVDSSIPSSQRSSPGTDAKLNFNQLSVACSVSSTTTVTTVPSSNKMGNQSIRQAHTEPTSNLQENELSKDPEIGSVQSTTNRMFPIGNERSKSSTNHPSTSVENIKSIFHSFSDSKEISFIAENTDDLGQDLYHNKKEAEKSVAALSSSIKISPDISDQQSRVVAPTTSFSTTISLNENENFIPISQSVLQQQSARDYDETNACDVATEEGVKPKNEPSKEMTLNPQTTSKQAAGHKNAVDNNIPPSLPLTAAKHANSESPGADGDSKGGNPCEAVSNSAAAANGAGDIGTTLNVAITPTSPSVDMDLKMESARKAWENTTESSINAGKAPAGKSDSNYFQVTSNALSNSHGNEPIISSISDSALKDSQTTEWQTTHCKNTPPTMDESEGSWRDGSQQKPLPPCVSSSAIPVVQQQQPEFSDAVQSCTSSNQVQEVQNSSGLQFSNPSTGVNTSIEATNTQLLPTYEPNTNYYLLDQSAPYVPSQPRMAAPQTQTIYQPISTSGLAPNMHQIQQYAPSAAPYNSAGMGVQPTAQPGFNSQAREFTPMLMNPTTMNSPATANMGQQNNMNSQQYAMHRPHNGAPSPHGQTLLIPVEGRALMSSSQPTAALLNSQMNRSQSASFHGQTGNSSYFSQQPPATHLTNQQYQTPLQPYQQRQVYPMKAAISSGISTLGMENMTLGPPVGAGGALQPHQNPHQMYTSAGNQGNPPAQQPPPPSAAAVQPRLRIDPSTDYSPHHQSPAAAAAQYPSQYYTKHPSIASNVMNKNMTNISASNLQGNAQPFEHQHHQQQQPLKHNNAVVGGYNNPSVKFTPSLYQVPKSSETIPANQFGNKYDNNSVHNQAKPYAPTQGVMPVDWSKYTSSAQQRSSHVPQTFSRPYSSTNDNAYQLSSNMSKGGLKPIDTQASGFPGNAYAPQQQNHRYDQNTSNWNAATSKLTQAHLGVSQSSQQQQMSILGKPPIRPISNAPMMNSPRFPITPFQTMQSGPVNLYQPGKPPQVNPRMQQPSINPYANPMDKSRQSPAIPASYGNNHNKSGQKQMQSSGGNKSNKHGGGGGGSKAPPVPTLVRGSASSLIGKKPTHLPEEVVKSNQANERASLLQSLSSFMLEKNPSKSDSMGGDPSTTSTSGGSWSAKVANSSPLPQRKPGMRHPGVEKFKDAPNRRNDNNNRNRRGRNGRKQNPDNDKPPQQLAGSGNGALATVAAIKAKKLTLADTKPKKGEVSKINIRETSAVGTGVSMVKPPPVAADTSGSVVE